MHPLLVGHEPQIRENDESRKETCETIDNRRDDTISANINIRVITNKQTDEQYVAKTCRLSSYLKQLL